MTDDDDLGPLLIDSIEAIHRAHRHTHPTTGRDGAA